MVAQDPDTETETEEQDTRPVRSIFESAWLIDNQSVLVPIEGTFEFDMQHRFGTWQNGYDDFYGLFASSNIRLGFSYTVIDRLAVGFGITKSNMTWDISGKYAILRQTRSGNIPISITYFGNIAIDTRKKDNFNNSSDRYSFFNQIIIARKITPEFSAQIAPSYSHFNSVEAFINSSNEIESIMNNDHFAISVAGRYKVSDVMAIIANYDQPITKHKSNNPNPNISFGVEMATSSHTFQIFAGNYYFITPQRNNVFNQNNPEFFSDFLIGFNITRLWNF
ncbi:MAG: hypothetical protein DRI70_04415 [Bacteroidetes bacterium]|nr:MAG: hypothetical protein DRI70_04415 [Bacteroidota bacterium]